MRCQALTKSGKPCQAYALKGKKYCLTHDTESREKFLAMTKKGGQVKKKIQVCLAPIEFRGNIKDVLNLLADTVNQVRTNQMPPRIANTIGYLAGHMIKALEIAEINDRLKKVERIIFERKTYQD